MASSTLFVSITSCTCTIAREKGKTLRKRIKREKMNTLRENKRIVQDQWRVQTQNTERCVKLAGSAGPLCRVWELNRGARNRNICKILSHSALITQQVINMNREALSFFPLENFSYSQYALLFEPVHPPQCIANGAERLQTMRWLHSEQGTAWFWFVDMEKERDFLFVATCFFSPRS